MSLSPAIRRWSLGLYWTAIFALTHVPDIDRFAPDTDWLPESFDLLVHFSFFAGWMAIWWWVLTAAENGDGRGRTLKSRQLRWLLVGGAAYAAFDELTQALVGRTPDIADWLVDVAGLGAAAVLLWRWQNRRRPLQVEPPAAHPRTPAGAPTSRQ